MYLTGIAHPSCKKKRKIFTCEVCVGSYLIHLTSTLAFSTPILDKKMSVSCRNARVGMTTDGRSSRVHGSTWTSFVDVVAMLISVPISPCALQSTWNVRILLAKAYTPDQTIASRDRSSVTRYGPRRRTIPTNGHSPPALPSIPYHPDFPLHPRLLTSHQRNQGSILYVHVEG